MTTLSKIFIAALFACVSLAGACGGSSKNNPDMVMPQQMGDMAVAANPDMVPSCATAPTINCSDNPTTHEEIINGCVGSDVTKVDVTPFYPAMGYQDNGCKLPAPPQ